MYRHFVYIAWARVSRPGYTCKNITGIDLSWWFQQRCSSLFVHQAMNSLFPNMHEQACQQPCSSWPVWTYSSLSTTKHVQAGQPNHVQAGQLNKQKQAVCFCLCSTSCYTKCCAVSCFFTDWLAIYFAQSCVITEKFLEIRWTACALGCVIIRNFRKHLKLRKFSLIFF